MSETAKGLRPGALQLTFGAALCALLLFFAVATKLAGYYPHDPSVEPIAAAKVWQDTGASSSLSVEVEQVRTSPALLDLLAAIPSLVLIEAWYFSTEQPGNAVPSWFSPFLSVRPPPAI